MPERNFHVTMHFIGESNDLTGAAGACDEAVRGIRPFVLRLGGYKSFERGQLRTGYAWVHGDMNELNRLHETLVSALAAQGFSLAGGHKRLTPHITLARDLAHANTVAAGMERAGEGLQGGSAWTVNSLVLYESRTVGGGGMQYTPLHTAAIR